MAACSAAPLQDSPQRPPLPHQRQQARARQGQEQEQAAPPAGFTDFAVDLIPSMLLFVETAVLVGVIVVATVVRGVVVVAHPCDFTQGAVTCKRRKARYGQRFALEGGRFLAHDVALAWLPSFA